MKEKAEHIIEEFKTLTEQSQTYVIRQIHNIILEQHERKKAEYDKMLYGIPLYNFDELLSNGFAEGSLVAHRDINNTTNEWCLCILGEGISKRKFVAHN